MKRVKMLMSALVGGLLVSSVLSVPVTEQKQKVTKRDTGSMSRESDDISVGDYRGEILPGMVDDQVAEAFLKDAARQDERQQRRNEEEEEDQEDEEEDGPIEVPLALPMAHIGDSDLLLGRETPALHRSKALSSEDVYPAEDEGYLPYYPSRDVYYRRRRRSRPMAQRVVHKRSPITSVGDLVHPSRLRSARRKRQIHLSDNDLNVLISFLSNLKATMERASEECDNPAHRSFFREKELNEEQGAGSGIDEDYGDDELPSSSEQEYPVWLMPHSHQIEPVMAVPQRRSFYYPTMLPGQKRSMSRYSSPQQRLESKLLGLRRASDSSSPPIRFFQ